MKIGRRFIHYPTQQRGIVKGHLCADGKFRALLDNGKVCRVKISDCNIVGNPGGKRRGSPTYERADIEARIKAMQASKYPNSTYSR